MSDEQQERIDHLMDAGYMECCEAERTFEAFLISHCSSEYPHYIIGVQKRIAWMGEPHTFDELPVTGPDVKERLAKFAEALRISLPGGEPRWILASDFSA